MSSKLENAKKTAQNEQNTNNAFPSSVITQVSKSEKPASKLRSLFNLNKCLVPIWKTIVYTTRACLAYETSPLLLEPQSDKFKGKKTLVLDIDETLLHSTYDPNCPYDFVLPVKVRDVTYEVRIIKRPGVEDFLKKVCEIFEVVIFTASLPEYAVPLMHRLGVAKSVSAILVRDSCTIFNKHLVKDLSRLGRDLKDVILVDNSPNTFIFQPENAYHIKSFFNDMKDNELHRLLPFLEQLAKHEDVRPIESHRKKFERNQQINFTREIINSMSKSIPSLKSIQTEPQETSKASSKWVSLTEIPESVNKDTQRKYRAGEEEAMRVINKLKMKKLAELEEQNRSSAKEEALDVSQDSTSSSSGEEQEETDPKISEYTFAPQCGKDSARLYDLQCGRESGRLSQRGKDSSRLTINSGTNSYISTPEKQMENKEKFTIMPKALRFSGFDNKENYVNLEPENINLDTEETPVDDENRILQGRPFDINSPINNMDIKITFPKAEGETF